MTDNELKELVAGLAVSSAVIKEMQMENAALQKKMRSNIKEPMQH